MSWLSGRRFGAAVLSLAIGVVALSGCAAGAPEPSATATPTPAPASAGSIVAIGHSGLTGFGSDPTSPGSSVPANSWATGTNPEVDSVFLRMRENDPGLAAFNFAVNGSDVDSLLTTQAPQAVAVEPVPKLIIVQSVANDIRCDGTDSENYEVFRTKLTQVMDILTSGAPDADILFVSQWASVQKYVDVLREEAPAVLAGVGPCGVNDSASATDIAADIAELQGIVEDYERIIADVCAGYENCIWDGGAQHDMDLEAADLAPDHVHLSVAGLHKVAEIAWGTLAETTTG
jgi:hypothetical protein